MVSDRRSDIETLTAVIARSPIVAISQPVSRSVYRRLPAGFEAVDAAILGWIAAEARRINRRYLPN